MFKDNRRSKFTILFFLMVAGTLEFGCSREKFIDLAKGYGYEIIEINFEAGWDVLSKRFEERVAGALANPERRVANLSKERFKEIFDISEREKNPSALTFRTDKQSIEEISNAVMKLL